MSIVSGISLATAEGGKRPRPPFRSLFVSNQVVIRLGLAFTFIVALLVAVGDLGLRRMDQINADLQNIAGRQWTKLILSREALTLSSHNSRITMQIFLANDKGQIDALLAERRENSRRIGGLISDLDGLCESEQEKQLLALIQKRRILYIESYAGALHLLIDERQRSAAVAVMAQQATPNLLAYQNAWDGFERFQGDQFELIARKSRTRYAATRRLSLFTILFAVLAAGFIAFLVIKGILGEITSRMQAEKEALHMAHQEAEVFIDAVPSILIGIDQESRITRWNLTAAGVFGLSDVDVLGKRLADCGVKWLRRGVDEEIHSWASGQVSRRCDQVSFEVEGETHLLGLTITPVHMPHNLTKTLVIGSDVTERSALEAQLHQSQKLESVGQLAAGIAHEINTPTQYIGDNVRFLKDAFGDMRGLLASYEGLLRALRESTVSPEMVREVSDAVQQMDVNYLLEEIPKAIEQTLEGVSRVSRLVSAMKEFSHPGTKEKIPLDLNHAIENTITVARNEWKYVAELETDFEPSLPLIPCQPGEFNQVILNLIVNAAHAIAEVAGKTGAGKGKIRIQTLDTPDWVEIRIQDSGSGIPERARSRVFDPFFTTKEIGKGTGQGLAIARSVVVDKHGGTIHFETEEGKGTTFFVRLPHEGKALTAKAAHA
jgi:PAS domain S-box-containing protein